MVLKHVFEYGEGVSTPAVQHAEALLGEGFTALTVAGAGAGDTDMFELARISARAMRRAEQQMVSFAAELSRRSAFSARGMRTVNGLMELLGLDLPGARRVQIAAEQVMPRVDLQGQPLPPRLPGTAAAFAAGIAGLQHVQVVATLMNSAAADRLPPDIAASAEEIIAGHIGDYTPFQLRNWGAELLDKLDHDGARPAEDDPPEQEPVNTLTLRPDPAGTGGVLQARFDDPALYELIAAVIDARARPLTEDDRRPLGQRQADALADVFGYVAAHGDRAVAPGVAGRRPNVTVTIALADLERRARAACLDFAGVATPTALRLLCCDARVIPVVLNGAGQPLDIGRAQRVVPEGLRRAVVARDGGCAHPGCDRPVSWSEIHHIIPWECGGETKLSNVVMLCRVHHRQIHYSEWEVRIPMDGFPEFVPPIWIDPCQRPRRAPRPPLGWQRCTA